MTESRIDAGTLYRDYGELVARLLLRQGVAAAEVPDLVQEVFLVVHRKGGFLLGGAKPSTWLAAIAIRVAMRRARSSAREAKRELVDSAAVGRALAPCASPGDATQTKEELRRVRRALREIPGAKRAVFVMFELEGRSCEEIATALHIPVGTVYSRLHAAREMFARNWRSAAVDKPLALAESVSYLSVGA